MSVHVAVSRSSSGGVATRHVLPVLCFFLFHIMGSMARRVREERISAETAAFLPPNFFQRHRPSTRRGLRTGGEVCYLPMPC